MWPGQVQLRVFLLALLVCAAPAAWPRGQPPFIEKLLQGDDAIAVTGGNGAAPVVTLGRRFGGSVVSIYYRGAEYINNHIAGDRVEYGRQLQSAAQYRDAGECFNPTEAGGRYDRDQPGSSSRLLKVERPKPNVLLTETDMAFWLAPGEVKDRRGKSCTALNTDYRAGYLLRRTLQVGVDAFPNVILYQTQFIAPIVEPSPRYVPAVIHTPNQVFTRVFVLRRDGGGEELKQVAQRGDLPYIQASADAGHAVAVCSTTKVIYGYRRGGNTTVSRFVYFANEPQKESPVFLNYVIVGTLSEVREAGRRFCFGRA